MVLELKVGKEYGSREWDSWAGSKPGEVVDGHGAQPPPQQLTAWSNHCLEAKVCTSLETDLTSLMWFLKYSMVVDNCDNVTIPPLTVGQSI